MKLGSLKLNYKSVKLLNDFLYLNKIDSNKMMYENFKFTRTNKIKNYNNKFNIEKYYLVLDNIRIEVQTQNGIYNINKIYISCSSEVDKYNILNLNLEKKDTIKKIIDINEKIYKSIFDNNYKTDKNVYWIEFMSNGNKLISYFSIVYLNNKIEMLETSINMKQKTYSSWFIEKIKPYIQMEKTYKYIDDFDSSLIDIITY